jgi:acetyl esterase/lipase
MASSTPSAVPQPPYTLHASVKDRLHPDYANFYNEHLINLPQVQLQPVAASRTSGTLILGGGPPLPVGHVQDISIRRRETEGPDVKVRVFTPEGERPEKGWPVTIYFHGGGWVLGNIETENTVCTHLCSRARSVVVSVDYR